MISSLLSTLGFAVCHQLPERSSIFSGPAMITCARCSGIYIAFTISSVYLLLTERGRTLHPSFKMMSPAAAYIGLMALDGLTSYSGLRDTSNLLRFLTGLMAGSALPLLIVPALNYFFIRKPEEEPMLETLPKALVFYLLPFLYVTLFYLAGFLSGAFLNLLAGISIIFVFLIINTSLAGVGLFSFEKADKLRATVGGSFVIILFAVIMSAAELRLLVEVHTYLNRF